MVRIRFENMRYVVLKCLIIFSIYWVIQQLLKLLKMLLFTIRIILFSYYFISGQFLLLEKLMLITYFCVPFLTQTQDAIVRIEPQIPSSQA